MRRERLGECFFRIRLPPFVRAAAFSIGSACLLLCRIAVLAKVGCLILMPTTVATQQYFCNAAANYVVIDGT